MALQGLDLEHVRRHHVVSCNLIYENLRHSSLPFVFPTIEQSLQLLLLSPMSLPMHIQAMKDELDADGIPLGLDTWREFAAYAQVSFTAAYSVALAHYVGQAPIPINPITGDLDIDSVMR